MSIIIIKTFIFTLLFTLSFAAHSPAPAPQIGSDDSLSPSLSPPAPSPESDLTPPPSSPLTPSPPADTPSPADAPFAENVKSEERKEGGSGRIVAGVVAAVCVVGLGHLGGVLYKKLQQNMADNPGFVFVKGELGNDHQYYLIDDDHIFPQNRVRKVAPEPLRSLTKIIILDNVNRYQCFYGDLDAETKRVVMWNPMWNPADGEGVECVHIDIPISNPEYKPRVGFGVCPRTGDTKLVKIDVKSGKPEVELFTIDTRSGTYVSRIVYVTSRIRRDLECAKVCEKGVIYFRAYDNIYLDHGVRTNLFVSFNLVTEKFGEVPLPWSLPSTGNFIQSVKVNGSLGLLDYHDGVCDVWIKREGASGTFFWIICNFFGIYETFTKIRTIRVEDQDLYGNVLGFRNNGDVIIELDVNNEESPQIVVYEQGHIRDVGIRGMPHKFSVRQL